MPDVIELSGYSLLEVNGRDARAFLQAQTMNDVHALGDGDWQWSGLLNPKGRVLFLFQVLRLSETRFWLLQQVPRAAALAKHLTAFRFRSKVDFTVPEAQAAYAAESAAAAGVDAEITPWRHRETPHGHAICLAPIRPGWLVLGAPPDSNCDGDDSSWRARDLVAGLPRISEDGAGSFTPHMLQLQRISAFSIKKGCYPGQEIVARTHFLGAPKRRMQLLRGMLSSAPVELRDAGGESLGEVVDSCLLGDEWLVLCVLKSFLAEGLGIDTTAGRLVASEGW